MNQEQNKKYTLLQMVKRGLSRKECFELLRTRYSEKKSLRKLSQWPGGDALQSVAETWNHRFWIFAVLVILNRIIEWMPFVADDPFGSLGARAALTLVGLVLWISLMYQLRYGNKAMLALSWVGSLGAAIGGLLGGLGGLLAGDTTVNVILVLIYGGVMLYIFLGFNKVWRVFFPEGLSRLRLEHIEK